MQPPQKKRRTSNLENDMNDPANMDGGCTESKGDVPDVVSKPTPPSLKIEPSAPSAFGPPAAQQSSDHKALADANYARTSAYHHHHTSKEATFNVSECDKADLFSFGSSPAQEVFDVTVLRKGESQSGIIMMQAWRPPAPSPTAASVAAAQGMILMRPPEPRRVQEVRQGLAGARRC
jgi:hypothetical protein